MSTRQPTRISELFASKWLSGGDLEKPVVVTVTEAGLQTVRQMDGTSEEKLVISFHNASKRLIVNKTQAIALALHLGDEWDKLDRSPHTFSPGHLAKWQIDDRSAGRYADVGSGAERDAGAAPRTPATTTGAAGSVRPRPGAVAKMTIEAGALVILPFSLCEQLCNVRSKRGNHE